MTAKPLRLSRNARLLAGAGVVIVMAGFFWGCFWVYQREFRDIETAHATAVEHATGFVALPSSASVGDASLHGEIGKEAFSRMLGIAVIGFLLIALATSLVALFYRHRRVGIIKSLLAAEQQRAEAQDTYELVFDGMLNGFAMHEMIYDAGGNPIDYRFLSVNPAFERLTGLKASRVVGRTAKEVLPGLEPPWIARYGEVVATGKGQQFEDFSSAIKRHFRVSAFRAAPGKFGTIFDDITERKESELKISNLSRLYNALSQCNNAVVNTKSEEELFAEICRVVVDVGGLKMAWVGKVVDSSLSVARVSVYGEGTSYLDGIQISVDADLPTGRGPGGTALRENRPVWCHNFQTDPLMAPWHDRASAHGWVAAAGIPLRIKGQPRAVLVLYSDLDNAFDPECRNLLLEVADNISFAMDSFEKEAARNAAEEELINLRRAVEQTGSAIEITNQNGLIEFVNSAFEKNTGYSSDEVIGKNPRFLNSGEQPREFYNQLWETITQGKTWQGQFHNKRKDGTLFWEAATISPVLDASGHAAHYIAVKEDITERKALESSLLDALDCAEAANRAKSEFLAVMSHELRTPLNGVLGYADLLVDTPLDDTQRDFAQTIKASGSHLLQVVNDILDFSSMEHGKLRLEVETVSIRSLLNSTCDLICGAATEKGLDFRCQIAKDIPEDISGDPLRIRQILINLLGNAIKFTASGSVTLEVKRATFQNVECLDFTVKDTGPGIPLETVSLLFKPFTQADSALHRPFEGSGLGLAISQRLAEAMKGKICLTSVPGEGSEFTFHLPLPQDAPLQSNLTSPAEGLKGR